MPWWVFALLGWIGSLIAMGLAWASWRAIEKAQERLERAVQAECVAIQTIELLREMAVQSFMMQHRGTFHAWAQHMGSFKVNIETQLQDPFEIEVITNPRP